MPTVADDLILIQLNLHDAGAIWSRAELLEWYRDGYRQLIARSEITARWTVLEVPGRVSYARTYDWEARYVNGGTSWLWTLATHDGYRHVAHAWEAQQVASVTPSASVGGYTQPWERAHAEDGDRPFLFALPRNHAVIKAVWWDHKRLEPITVRDLDEAEVRWMRLAGEPTRWTDGLGRNRTFEIYAIAPTYRQTYHLAGDVDARGIPRLVSGDRTYQIDGPVDDGTLLSNTFGYSVLGEFLVAFQILGGYALRFTLIATLGSLNFLWCCYPWEVEQVEGDPVVSTGGLVATYLWESVQGADPPEILVGTLRQAESPDRQYWAQADDYGSPLGMVVDCHSSEDALLVHEVVIPDVNELNESHEPSVIPEQARKYLRYYVWSRAFGRPGEGHNPQLAQHYEQRFLRGVRLLKTLGDVAHQDRHWQREPSTRQAGVRRPGVRLPSNFPAVV